MYITNTIDLDDLLDLDIHLKPNLATMRGKSQTFLPPSVSTNTNLSLRHVSQEIKRLPHSTYVPSNLSLAHRALDRLTIEQYEKMCL